MGQYFHVLLHMPDRDPVWIFKDLTDADLKTRFVKPWKKGQSLVVAGHVYDLKNAKSVQVFETTATAKATLNEEWEAARALNDEMAAGGLVIISPGPTDMDLAEIGTDVTSTYIANAAGTAGWWSKVAGSPWTLWIVGLIAAAMLGWLGLK